MPASPRVTVFIPVHNRQDYVCTAVNSILAQTFTDFELLVVDDGSSDATLERLARYRDSRLRVETNGRNLGIPATRNRGLELARGEYIALLDSDDHAYRERLARQVRWLDRHPDIVQSGSWCSFMDGEGRPLRKVRRQPLRAEDVHAHMLFHCPLVNRTIMARTAVLREYGYSEDFPRCQDYDLHERLASQHRMANLGEYLVCGREHAGRFTGRTAALGRERKLAVYRRQLEGLGIDCDDAVLERHYGLARPHEAGRLREDIHSYIDWAEDWLLRLRRANQQYRRYPPAAFSRVSAAIWTAVCWHGRAALGKRLPLRLAGSPLIRALPGNVHSGFLQAALRRPPPLALQADCPDAAGSSG